jgi:hypoxanthine phosphoribosyltransferase
MRCPNCPVAPGETCLGETGHLPHFCAWAADPTPSRLGLIVDRSRLPAPAVIPSAAAWAPDVPVLDPWAYVTTERLVRDALALAGRVPPDVDLVVGAARSGLVPAAVLAAHLHLPLRAASRHAGVTDPGHGFRLETPGPAPRHVLFVDDTAANGYEVGATLPRVKAAFPGARVTTAVVYCHPQARHAVDLCAALYPGVHFLEWNWPNAGHGAGCAYDFDGVLCDDCPPQDDDDGPRYLSFIENTRPKFLPRRAVVPLVVTMRHEKYRAPTEAWLARHGVRVARLVMRDWDPDPSRDWNAQAAEYKARHYAGSACTLFAESEPAQARLIAELAGRPVLCPSLDRVLPGAPPPPPPAAAKRHPAALPRTAWGDRIATCPYRDPAPGGAVCHARRGPDGDEAAVWEEWCRACLEACDTGAEGDGEAAADPQAPVGLW